MSIGGIVTGLRPLKTKKGDRMAVFMLDDEGGKVEVVVFPETFGKFGGLITADAMLLVRGKFERDEETAAGGDRGAPLDLVRERAVREVAIHLGARAMGKDTMQRVAAVLDRHRGDRRVSFVMELNGGGPHLRVRTATARRVRPSDHFVREVEAVCGAGSVLLK